MSRIDLTTTLPRPIPEDRSPWIVGDRIISAPGRAAVMGIVNVTPDSFSDGRPGRSLDASIEHALRLVSEGADLLDIGGESTRPGSAGVSLDEELSRVIPLLDALRGRLNVPISVDTSKAEVARRALDAGAAIINDITGLAGDPEMASLCAARGAGVVVMHMQGTPSTMQVSPHYDDVVAEVRGYLAGRIDYLMGLGLPRERIAVDPGLGFGKTFEQNLDLLRQTSRFASLGCPVLVGTSRKGFLGTLTGRPVSERAAATVASSLAAIARGAQIVRVHDVGPMVDAIKVWAAIEGHVGEGSR
ncbi:dihydropteroate synthase [Isosphaeraceae bacterium EP7]